MMLHSEHECDISEAEDDILFLPGRGPLRKLHDVFRLFLMASKKNPAAYKCLRSTASIVHEKRRHWRSYTHVIHPFSMFRYCWDIFMIIVMTSLLILGPYHATFEIGIKVRLWNVSKNILLFWCNMDIVVNFLTGYFDKETTGVMLEQKKIISNYVKSSTFFFDLLGSFPTDIFFINQWFDLIVTRKAVSLICIFRVFSLRRYIKRLAYAHNVSFTTYEFGQILLWIILILHWQSCFQWLIPIITTSGRHVIRPSEDSWIHVSNLWEIPKSQQYLASTLRSIATFLRANLLVLNRSNTGDIFLITLLELLGVVAPWFVITRVMQYLKGSNSSRLRYQGTMAQLKQYMRHKQLPYPTQRRITQYYEFHFQRRYFRESEIIHTLSAQIRHEISMQICRKLVENVTFFNNLPLSLLGRIVALLKSEIFLTNDVIVRANQPGNCMYFIATGMVAIYTTSGKEVCHLEDGAHFGEVALVMPSEMRVASVVAIETCELYRLDRADFERTIHPYPMLWERIKKIAIERHEQSMILNEQ